MENSRSGTRCPNCGAPLKRDRMSCEYCGTDIPDHGRDLVLNVRYETGKDVLACRELAETLARIGSRGRIFG